LFGDSLLLNKQPSAKKALSPLFGCYVNSSTQSTAFTESTPGQLLTSYLYDINPAASQLSSVPVERVFSQSGLIMRLNRACMSDTLLEELVFLMCNDC